MLGGAGMFGGSFLMTAEIAFCTSCAAASILRSRANCSVTLLWPRELDEVMLSRPAMVVNCRSRGAATDDAMVSGLAPGRLASTWRVGKSMLGRSLTGRVR